jgi:hypothetical protein
MLPQFAPGRNSRMPLGTDVSQQFILSLSQGSSDRDGKFDGGVIREDNANFVQFDPMTSDLCLPVAAPAKLDLPVRPSNSEIACAIHAGGRRPYERIRQEALRG